MKADQRETEAIARVLSRAECVWLTTHVKSDGDGVGCELALERALKAMGKDVHVINDTPVPSDLRFLLRGEEEILVYEPEAHRDFLGRTDAVVVLDVGEIYRLGRLKEVFMRSTAAKVCLDHHGGCDPVFHHRIVEPSAGSTGEILFGLLRAMGTPLTEKVATPIFAAISVDTGSFSYERCTPDTFHTGAELVAAGAKPYAIHLALNWQRRIGEVRLEGEVIKNLRLDFDGALAYSEISHDMLDRYGIDPMEMPAVVNIPLVVRGVELAFLFVESGVGSINVSVRSKGRIHVDGLARSFGGGGHPLASGFSIEGTLKEAKARVLNAAGTLMGRSKTPCDTA